MNVYLVYSGRFDDHGLDGVFSTRERAQEFIDEGSCDAEPYIKSLEVDNPPTKEDEPQLPIFNCYYRTKTGEWWAEEVEYKDAMSFNRVVVLAGRVAYVTTYQCKDADEALEMAKEDIEQFIKDENNT